jgi:hypothetical protein
MEAVPYTAESVEKAQEYQRWARLQAARKMGMPSHLVDLCEVYGFKQVREWLTVIMALSHE